MSRILIMDDDDRFRKMLREMLEVAGHEVVDAPDGKIGTKLYREDPADLIILDIFMPEKEGIETVIELKRDFPDVKIIAISAGGRMGQFDYLERAKTFGALKSFAKPFDRREMLEAIDECLIPKRRKS